MTAGEGGSPLSGRPCYITVVFPEGRLVVPSQGTPASPHSGGFLRSLTGTPLPQPPVSLHSWTQASIAALLCIWPAPCRGADLTRRLLQGTVLQEVWAVKSAPHLTPCGPISLPGESPSPAPTPGKMGATVLPGALPTLRVNRGSEEAMGPPCAPFQCLFNKIEKASDTLKSKSKSFPPCSGRVKGTPCWLYSLCFCCLPAILHKKTFFKDPGLGYQSPIHLGDLPTPADGAPQPRGSGRVCRSSRMDP